MRNYLSMGFGVNSVALYLYLTEQGVDFEAVFVHHGTDWPETYDYAAMFQWWLKSQGLRPVTILRPQVRTNDGKVFSVLYDYYEYKRLIPMRASRQCTERFKVRPLHDYFQTPCFSFIGIDADEAHRAKLSYKNGIENRWPLIEAGIGREGCKSLIRRHGLPVPPKSGCYICPFMGRAEFKRLRSETNLICSVRHLEGLVEARRTEQGKTPLYLKDMPIDYYTGRESTQSIPRR